MEAEVINTSSKERGKKKHRGDTFDMYNVCNLWIYKEFPLLHEEQKINDTCILQHGQLPFEE